MKKTNCLGEINKIIRNETGIIIKEDRLIDLEIVVKDRLQKTNLNETEYLVFLKFNTKEIIKLASVFTIQETSFYRNKSHFDRLKREVFPRFIEQCQTDPGRKLRILSAGCATGEEPYTISMIINDLIPAYEKWDIEILGTDINQKAINFAKEGVYSAYKLRNLSNWYKEKYFEEVTVEGQTHYKIVEKVRKFVRFENINLIHEPFMLSGFTGTDIIFCENVIIYFRLDSTERLIDNFYKILKDQGFLFLGYSETLNMIKHHFALSWNNESYAYRKETTTTEINDNEVLSILSKIRPTLSGSNLTNKNEMLYSLFEAGDMKKIDDCIELCEGMNEPLNVDEGFFTIKAEYLFDKGDLMNAANECRKAIYAKPDFLDSHIILAMLYLELNMTDNALFELKTALYIDKDSTLAHYYMARYHAQMNDSGESAGALRTAAKLLKQNNGKLKCGVFPVKKEKYLTVYNELLKAV